MTTHATTRSRLRPLPRPGSFPAPAGPGGHPLSPSPPNLDLFTASQRLAEHLAQQPVTDEGLERWFETVEIHLLAVRVLIETHTHDWNTDPCRRELLWDAPRIAPLLRRMSRDCRRPGGPDDLRARSGAGRGPAGERGAPRGRRADPAHRPAAVAPRRHLPRGLRGRHRRSRLIPGGAGGAGLSGPPVPAQPCWSSLKTRMAFSRRNLGHTWSLNPTSGISRNCRSRLIPAGK
jgi:hypothetical protein